MIWRPARGVQDGIGTTLMDSAECGLGFDRNLYLTVRRLELKNILWASASNGNLHLVG